MNTRFLAAIVGAVATSTAVAQWTLMSPATSPGTRMGAAMATDPFGGRVVMFGGVGGTSLGTSSDETWSYDGTTWTLLSPTQRPAARLHMDMVFDSSRGVFVLYGGQSSGGGGALNETWEFNGVDWTQRFPAANPGNLCLHAMAFDSVRNKVVLFGGYPGGFPAIDSNRTWEYDGTNWTQRFPATNPGAHEAMSMCFDSAAGRTILFGGVDATPSAPPNLVDNDKTWSWDGTNWTELSIAGTRPPRRERAKMAFDSVRGVSVLTGGMHYSNGAAKNDTWELFQNGSAGVWLQVVTPTVGRYSSTLAFLPAERHLVQFGGVTGSNHWLGDTREYGAQVATFGSGCAGTNGVPALTALDAPRISQSWSLSIANMNPAFNFAIIVIGFTPIPGGLDLGPALGMPGCTGWQTPDQFYTAPTGAGGSTIWSIAPVPDVLGVTFSGQALCYDPTVNSFGWTVSNAIAATIGY
jgi:hypothetical protein